MHGPTIRESRTPSCSCRTVKTERRMDQASGSRESSLQLLLCLSHDEKQRCRCRELWRDIEKQRLQESRSMDLPWCLFPQLLVQGETARRKSPAATSAARRPLRSTRDRRVQSE